MAKSEESEHLAGVFITSELTSERNCCPEQGKQLHIIHEASENCLSNET